MVDLNKLDAFLAERRAQHLYRQRKIFDGPQGPVTCHSERNLISFCSNDYLGLANHPAVVKAFKQGVDKFGVGSGASHLINGHTRAHHALEETLAEFVQRPKALLFSTGYMANLGVLTALLDQSDAIFEDRLNHASLIDGGLFSGARLKRYRHADTQSLQNLLQNSESKQNFIVTDGVFSMDGDIAPLNGLAQTANAYGAWLMVDDAHGLGVLGQNGAGTLCHYSLNRQQVPILMGTLGKAIGTFGAFVSGDEDLIDTLIQLARPYCYTTALPAAVAEASRTSISLLQKESWRREKLNALVLRFRTGANQLSLNLLPSETPIQPLLVGDSEQALQLSQSLYEQGILISAVRPPTVPPDSARLRITFSAAHEETHVDQLLDALNKLL